MEDVDDVTHLGDASSQGSNERLGRRASHGPSQSHDAVVGGADLK